MVRIALVVESAFSLSVCLSCDWFVADRTFRESKKGESTCRRPARMARRVPSNGQTARLRLGIGTERLEVDSEAAVDEKRRQCGRIQKQCV